MKLIEDALNLRYYIRDSKARKHRYSVVDRLNNDVVLAKFDELSFAENTLQLYKDTYRRELENEHLNASLPFTKDGLALSGV